MSSPATPYEADHSFSTTSNDLNISNMTQPSPINDYSKKMNNFGLKERLASARKTIQEYTETALRAASSDVTLSGINLDHFSTSVNANSNNPFSGENPTGVSGGGTMNMWLRPPATSKELFEMGISIFEENDFNGGVENMIHARLGQVESDLREIMKSSSNSDHVNPNIQDDTQREPHDNDENNEMQDIFMDIDNLEINDDGGNTVTTNTSRNSHKEEALRLIFKVRFLRRCADARNKLDESSTFLSKDIVRSVQLLLDAEQIFHECENMIQQQSSNEVNQQNENASKSQVQNGAKAQDLHIANHILGSIHNRLLRQRSGLHSRASSILDTCLSITDSKITVKQPSRDKEIGGGLDSINAAYEVFSALSKKDENALTDVIYTMSSELYKVVFLTLIGKDSSIKSDLSSSFSSTRGNENKETIELHSYSRWSFQEHKLNDNNVTDPLGKSTPIITLEWKKVTTSNSSDTTIESKAINSHVEPWKHILSSITHVLDFLHTSVLMERTDLCSILGDYFFTGNFSKSSSVTSIASLSSVILSSETEMDGPLLKKLLEINWNSCVPSSASDVKEVGSPLLEASQEFENNLVKKGYISEDWINKGQNESKMSGETALPLSNFASTLEQKYAEKRRSKILTQGRNILLKDDFHNTTLVGVDPNEKPDEKTSFPWIDSAMQYNAEAVFVLHRCAISQVASSIMNLVRQTLDESISPDSLVSTGPHLYRASRELFDLFRAIIPTLHGSAITTIPRAAAILHNDCIFFAHQMLTLGHEYRERFSPDSHDVLKKMCTFVDFVPVFREMGDRVMVEMIERQKLQLANLVYERVHNLSNAIRMNEEVAEWAEAEMGVRAANYHLRHLSTAWVNILSRDVYGRSMGTLVDTLLITLLDQVMKTNDISAAASHFVGALFSHAMKTSELFSGGENEARKYSQLWEKFDTVRKFMDMSLANISTALSEGSFRSVTGLELSRLIQAAFDDSEKRRVILLALANE